MVQQNYPMSPYTQPPEVLMETMTPNNIVMNMKTGQIGFDRTTVIRAIATKAIRKGENIEDAYEAAERYVNDTVSDPSSMYDADRVVEQQAQTDQDYMQYLRGQDMQGQGMQGQAQPSPNTTWSQAVASAKPFLMQSSPVYQSNSQNLLDQVLPTREEAQLEQETKPWQIFEQFIEGAPGYHTLNPFGQEIVKSRFFPAYASFMTQTPKYDPETTIGGTFRDFVQGGGRVLSPRDLMTNLTGISQLFQGNPERALTAHELGMQARYADLGAEATASLFKEPYLRRVNPLFRKSDADVMDRIRRQHEATTPEVPFIQALPQAFSGFLS